VFVQGEPDPIGMPLEIENYDLSAVVRIHWIIDGNHDLNPRKKSGRTLEQNMAEAVAAITVFLDKLSS
jgi:predicted alpha/beta-hydrolase family hydrolase